MKSSLLLKTVLVATAVSVVSILSVRAQIVTNTFNFTFGVDPEIEDGSLTGFSDTRNLTLGITNLTDVRVRLHIDGGSPTNAGYNGDLYAYVTHDSGFSVLLNRTGRSSTNEFGYADDGFDVTFSTGAANGNVHFYQNVLNPSGGTLTGTWQPDGRNINPLSPQSSFDAAGTADLTSFNGLNANGGWTLFLVDSESVNTFVLHSWGLTLIGAIPEPGTYALFGMSAAGLLIHLCRRKS
jgi:hypothetical protein